MTLLCQRGRPIPVLPSIVAALVLACAVPAAAQNATAPAVKAAFLYTFVKFVEWPADTLPAAAPLVICVIGDDAVANALDQTFKGRKINDHGLATRREKVDGALLLCHLLYISGLDENRSIKLLHPLKSAPVLTVSDLDRFARLGGVAHFSTEDGKLQFALNVSAAQRAGLRLSSKLLGLAIIVKDEQDVQR